jgi:hypothetical protein
VSGAGPKISLAQQIEEVDRELALRKDVYEVAVSKAKMRRAVADYHMGRMVAVRNTLAWLQANEALIKQRLS